MKKDQAMVKRVVTISSTITGSNRWTSEQFSVSHAEGATHRRNSSLHSKDLHVVGVLCSECEQLIEQRV